MADPMQEHQGRAGRVEAARSRARAAPAQSGSQPHAASSRDAGLPERRPPRVVIESLEPQVDCGRFPVKRTVGEEVEVTADVHAEGHDVLAVVLLWRRAVPRGGPRTLLSSGASAPEGPEGPGWREVAMQPGANDVWSARFRIASLEPHEFTVEAWVDRFRTWRRALERKAQAGQAVGLELLEGAELLEAAAARAGGDDEASLRETARLLRSDAPQSERVEAALEPELARLMGRWSERRDALRREPPLRVDVDRERARFSSWYELFPRSASATPGAHGTFADVERLLPYVAGMGFDVLYLPPIHPIGRAHRKGRNNSTEPASDDTGSPWAIGAEEGGHTAIHPALGTHAEFRRLVEEARGHGLEVALDLAFQCAPDHPWVEEHPQWFRRRPDGSIQHAENPPKRYQDIYPIDFETEDWRALWQALRGVVDFWIGEGVRIFRVDNPHTKPYAFWEWMIAEVRRAHPEVLFLSEAFTRPKVMYRLAKLGFSQSYTYFAWRNSAWEIREYFTELTRTKAREFFRPSLWPNTPDILTEHLQAGGRPAFAARAVLAATLGASWGIYGPAFELGANVAVAPGKEEYLDSEKYQIRSWDLEDRSSLRPLIALLNRIRRENPALQSDRSLRFHPTSDEQLLAYSKSSSGAEGGESTIVVVVNLDPHHAHGGMVELPLGELGLDAAQGYQMHDLLGGARYMWQGPRNYVHLDPASAPAHVFRLRRRLRTERDFDYFL